VSKIVRKCLIDNAAASRHLTEQLAQLRVGLDSYVNQNIGLDYSIHVDDDSHKVIITWTYNGRIPSKFWQENIRTAVVALLEELNLFICPSSKSPQGTFMMMLRIDDYTKLIIRYDNTDIVIPHYYDN
jgi:hypothetical protein